MFSLTKLEEMRPVSAINPRGGRGFNAPRRTKEVGSITNSRPSEAAREIEFRCTDAPDIPVNGNWYKAAGSVMIVTDAPEPIDPRSCATKPRRRAQLIEQSSNSLKSIYRDPLRERLPDKDLFICERIFSPFVSETRVFGFVHFEITVFVAVSNICSRRT